MIHSILAGLVGIVLTVLVLVAFYYRSRVKDAEQVAEESHYIALEATRVRENTEKAFATMKDSFDEARKQPLVAMFTSEQVDSLAKRLAAQMFIYGEPRGSKQ